jgi:hypothetical protein
MTVGNLIECIEHFCSEPVRLTGEEAARDLVELARGRSLLDVKFSKMAAAFARTDQYDRDGCISPIHWIRVNCHMTAGAAAGRVIVGEQVARTPASLEAVETDDIGFPHLALIAREADAASQSDRVEAFDEDRLPKKARDYTVGRFRNFCHHERHANDPDGYAARAAESTEARSLTLITGDGGMLWIRGVLDPEGGAVLWAALDPLAKRNGKADDRRMDRRLGDAIVELAHHAMDNGTLPRKSWQRPHLQLTATLETLLRQWGATAGELAFSLPISGRAVERIACDCNVTRILLGADSQVIDIGRSTRRISPHIRRALNARDRGCRWPGCDRPASWTSGHHMNHWARGGVTELQNLVLLCHRHHWMVHEGRWQLIKTDDGDYLTVPPMLGNFGQRTRAPDVDAVA